MNTFMFCLCFFAGLATWVFEFWWTSKVQEWGISEVTSLVLLTSAILIFFFAAPVVDKIKEKRRSSRIARLKQDEETVEYIPPPRKLGAGENLAWKKQKP